MHFFVRKRKQTPTVIIVALIDVLIVLLIFLIVTTTFKQQPWMQLALPESTQAKKPGANENPPLVVSVDPKGDVRFGAEVTPLTVERLLGELTARVATNAEANLAINADELAPWGKILKVRDAAKKANIKTVTAFTKEAGK